MTVKIHDGATYTIIERRHPEQGQRRVRWVGDNGQEIELTDEEAAALQGQAPSTEAGHVAPGREVRRTT